MFFGAQLVKQEAFSLAASPFRKVFMTMATHGCRQPWAVLCRDQNSLNINALCVLSSFSLPVLVVEDEMCRI